MGIATNLDLKIEQLDVKVVFLHEDLQEKYLMKQLEGYSKRARRSVHVN